MMLMPATSSSAGGPGQGRAELDWLVHLEQLAAQVRVFLFDACCCVAWGVFALGAEWDPFCMTRSSCLFRDAKLAFFG